MKIIGLIGGLGPEATVDYYKQIIEAFKDNWGHLNYPEIIIYSVNMSEFLELMETRQYENIVSMLVHKIYSLKYAGADYAALTANTPHLLFDRIAEKSPIPLISIVEATLDEAMNKGIRRAGLLGTAFTMNNTFFADVFSRKGIEVVVPDPGDKEIINYKLFSEIELGIFKDDTRLILEGIIEKMTKEKGIDSIILGCTEFPLILKESSYAGVPVLNTTAIHVSEIVKYCSGKLPVNQSLNQ